MYVMKAIGVMIMVIMDVMQVSTPSLHNIYESYK